MRINIAMKTGLCALLLSLPLAAQNTYDTRTSLDGWSTVQLREATEEVETRWEQVSQMQDLRKAAPTAFADAERAVQQALDGRRWNDGRERAAWNYQAQRAMDIAELKGREALLSQDISGLNSLRAELDEQRIELEASKQARLALAEQEAKFQAREAELARMEQEIAAREAALAKEEAVQQAARAEVAESIAAETAIQAAVLEQELASAMSDLEFERTMRGPVLVLGDVLFEVNGDDLKPGAEERLQQLHNFLTDHPEVTAQVEGHTDNTGTAEYNLDLSERRANSVRNYLLGLGLNPNQVSAVGFGLEKPVATNDTPEGRQQNRRVEIVFSNME